MRVEVLNVTPAMAEGWLARNISNRKINHPRVDLVKTGIPIDHADFEHIVMTLGRKLAEVRAQGKSGAMWITERVERVLLAYSRAENMRVISAAASNPWPVVL
mgnify:CR=1 FL=1